MTEKCRGVRECKREGEQGGGGGLLIWDLEEREQT